MQQRTGRSAEFGNGGVRFVNRLRAGVAGGVSTAAVIAVIAAGSMVLVSPLSGCSSGGGKGASVSGPREQNVGSPRGRVSDEPVTTSDVMALRERALVVLMESARSPSPEVRANAIEALSSSPRRLDEVIGDATRDPNIGVRAVAATVIGRERMSRHRGLLTPMLNDPDLRVASSAAYAMARLGDTGWLDTIGRAMSSDRVEVRGHAVFLLGELGDASATPMLRDALRRPPGRVGRPQLRMLELQVAEALTKLGDSGSVDAIRAALYPAQPQDLEAAALAAQILGQIRDMGSRDQLVYLTAERDGQGRFMPAEVRLAAAGALARLGLDRGMFIATPYLSDPNETLRGQAAYVLGQSWQAGNQTGELKSRLDRLFEDSSARVRVAAAAGVVKG